MQNTSHQKVLLSLRGIDVSSFFFAPSEPHQSLTILPIRAKQLAFLGEACCFFKLGMGTGLCTRVAWSAVLCPTPVSDAGREALRPDLHDRLDAVLANPLLAGEMFRLEEEADIDGDGTGGSSTVGENLLRCQKLATHVFVSTYSADARCAGSAPISS